MYNIRIIIPEEDLSDVDSVDTCNGPVENDSQRRGTGSFGSPRGGVDRGAEHSGAVKGKETTKQENHVSQGKKKENDNSNKVNTMIY